MRLEGLLAAHALRRPEHTAIVSGAVRMRYGELLARVQRVAHGLHTLGVKQGDRVLLVLPNCVEFVIAEYAAFSVGAVVVTVNPRLAADEVAHIVRDADPTVAIYRDDTRALLRRSNDGATVLHRIVVGLPIDGELAFGGLEQAPDSDRGATPPQPLPILDVRNDDALIMYTSGTTGRPKGALITHANMIVQNLLLQGQAWQIHAEDTFLAMNPLAHRAGCARLYNALGLGGTLVLMDKFDVELALQLIEQERVTVTGLVPTVIRMMLPKLRERPERCASLRRVIVSTEAFPVELKRELLQLLPGAQIHSVFGSTEVLATNLGHAEQFSHPASVGRPLPGVEVRVVDDAGRDVAGGEVGELIVRSGEPGRWATLREYFRQPQATAATIRDGWVYTGDLARADAEGYLYIVDRKKDMVISGGYNIYSKEVEQVLMTHPAVEDAAVIGVPDALFGEAVAAYVQARAGVKVDADELIGHCRNALATYKKPKHVRFLAALPRNSTGKVLKHVLRERFAAERESL